MYSSPKSTGYLCLAASAVLFPLSAQTTVCEDIAASVPLTRAAEVSSGVMRLSFVVWAGALWVPLGVCGVEPVWASCSLLGLTRSF